LVNRLSKNCESAHEFILELIYQGGKHGVIPHLVLHGYNSHVRRAAFTVLLKMLHFMSEEKFKKMMGTPNIKTLILNVVLTDPETLKSLIFHVSQSTKLKLALIEANAITEFETFLHEDNNELQKSVCELFLFLIHGQPKAKTIDKLQHLHGKLQLLSKSPWPDLAQIACELLQVVCS